MTRLHNEARNIITTNEATLSFNAKAIDKDLIAALQHPQDRHIVVKLEQDILAFVKNKAASELELPLTPAYHRLLAHKVSDYYHLSHVSDSARNTIVLSKQKSTKAPKVMLCNVGLSKGKPQPGGSKVQIMKREPVVETKPEPVLVKPIYGEPPPKNEKVEKEERYRAARARIFQGVAETGLGTEAGAEPKIKSRSQSRDSRSKKWDADDSSYSRDQFDSFVSDPEHEIDLQQRHSQYFQPALAEPFLPVSRGPKPNRAIWNSKSSAPLSMANLAQLEAQTARSSTPPALKTGSPITPSRKLATPMTTSSNLWGPPSQLTGTKASALGLNLAASPWTPKTSSFTGDVSRTKLSSAATFEHNEDDPTDVMRNLALDDK